MEVEETFVSQGVVAKEVDKVPATKKRALEDLQISTPEASDEFCDQLNCTVCWIFPRGGEIYTCDTGGHVLCGKCTASIKDKGDLNCPLCRDRNVRRNKFAERIMTLCMRTYRVNCQFDTNGCPEIGLVADMASHEDECKKRVVACPSVHRGTCKWQGLWERGLFQHVNNSNGGKDGKCVQKIASIQPGKPFITNIVDSPEEKLSVLKSGGVSNWLPMLLAVELEGGVEVIYVCVFRNRGKWTMIARTYAPERIRKRLRVKMTIYPAKKQFPCYSFSGQVNPHNLSDAEAVKAGRYLSFDDRIVAPMVQDNVMFEYSLIAEIRDP